MALIEISLTENGVYTDITNKVKKGTFKVDPLIIAPNAARSPMTGAGFAGEVAEKKKVTGSFNPMPHADSVTISSILAHEYVYANYLDNVQGWRTHVRFISHSVPAAARQIIAGVTLWDGASFYLEEV